MSVTTQEDTGRVVVHFVNYTSGYRRPITKVTPVGPIAVELRISRPVSRASLIRSGDDVAVESDGEVARFVVPTVEVYEAVVLEPA